jgi:PhzF family phenazine biosynthesis protein
MQLRIYQVDAFTHQLFSGNPAAVLPLEDWLSDDILQNIAAENNLSETAFFKREKGELQLRWFTPVAEVDLCGHATLGTAHVLWQHLGYQTDEISFHSRSGKLGVAKNGDSYTLDFPTDKLTKVDIPDFVRKALGAKPIESFKGREDYLLAFENQAAVAALSPDFQQLAKLEARGIIATAPGDDVDFVSRCFFPRFGINEDPVTGSAHTTLAPYWSKKLGKSDLVARQISRRGGDLTCRLDGERTFISGQAVTFLSGTIEV